MKRPLRDKSLSRAISKALNDAPQLLRKPTRTCVIVPDATRPLSHDVVLRPLLEQLCEAGHPVSVVVALGLHRPMTADELAPLSEVADLFGVEIIEHDAFSEELVAFGEVDGIPIWLNRHVVEAERLICVGTVEPHQYAGYSGGIKAVAIGCAGEETISAMHGLLFLRDEKTALGNLVENPFQAALWRVGAPVMTSPGAVLGLQFVPAPDGGMTHIFFDEIRPAFEQACDEASRLFFQEFDEPLSWIHLPLPAVKATNFYQASRAATYVSLISSPVVERGGAILLVAPCPEGIGLGSGERACAEAMWRGTEALLAELGSTAKNSLRGGEQRAYVLARSLDRHRIALIGAEPIAELESMGIAQFDSVDEAMDGLDLRGKVGCRVDDIFHRLPRLICRD